MLKQIVDSIIDAEKSAEQTVAKAQEQSKNILFEAQTKADEIAEKSVAENKKLAKSLEDEATAKADKQAAKVLADGKKQADENILKFNKNKDKTVDFVIGRLVDKCQ